VLPKNNLSEQLNRATHTASQFTITTTLTTTAAQKEPATAITSEQNS